MIAANSDDNPRQTLKSIYFLFKIVALYGSIFVTKMTTQQLLDRCAALRQSRYSPPSLEGLPSLWTSLKDILRPISHFQQYREFKGLFFKAVEDSVTDEERRILDQDLDLHKDEWYLQSFKISHFKSEPLTRR